MALTPLERKIHPRGVVRECGIVRVSLARTAASKVGVLDQRILVAPYNVVQYVEHSHNTVKINLLFGRPYAMFLGLPTLLELRL
jgi:hypothetical protein